jgi:hypothetical protein
MNPRILLLATTLPLVPPSLYAQASPMPPPGVNPAQLTTAQNFSDVARCVDIAQAPGTTVVAALCKKAPSQVWRFQAVPGGLFQIVNTATGKCLAIQGSSMTSGATAVQETCDARGSNQIWTLKLAGGNSTQIQIVNRRSSQCIEMNVNAASGAPLIQRPCQPPLSNRNQVFTTFHPMR